MPNQANVPIQRDQREALNREGERTVAKRKRAKGAGRKPKADGTLYIPISMRLHPKAFEWAKTEAEKRGIGYQSLINEILLEQMS